MNPSPNTPLSDSAGVASRGRRRRVLAALLVLAVLGAAFAYWKFHTRMPMPPELPATDDPGVIAFLREQRQAVLNERDSASAWGHLGSAFLANNFFPQAEVCLRQALALDPTEPRWPYRLGLLLEREDVAAAQPFLEKAADLADTPEPALRLANNFLWQGRFEDAGSRLTALRARFPKNGAIALARGRACLGLGDLDGAQRHLEEATDLPGPRHSAWQQLGELHQRRGRADLAARALEQARRFPPDLLDLGPLHAEVSDLLAGKNGLVSRFGRLSKMGKDHEALEQAEEAVATYPDWDHAYHLLGKATLALGLNTADAAAKLSWLQKSAAAFARAEELAPAEATHAFYRGSALYFFPDPSPETIEETGRHLERSIAIRPENALAHYYLAVLARRSGKADEAHHHLRQALLYQPDFPEAHGQFGFWLEEHGETFTALTHYVRAVRSTAPDGLWPRFWIGAHSRRWW